MIDVNYNEYKETIAQNMKLIVENHDLKEEIERLNNIINKINKLFDADAHCESIHYAIGVLLNKEYYDIENVWDEELLKILKGE